MTPVGVEPTLSEREPRLERGAAASYARGPYASAGLDKDNLHTGGVDAA